MGRDLLGSFDLLKPAAVIALALEHAFKCFPCSTNNRIRISIPGLASQGGRDLWVGSTESLDITEKPCLQFLDRDAVQHHKRSSIG